MKKSIRRLTAVLFSVMLVTLLAAAACASTPMSEFDYARYGSDYPDVLRAYGQQVYRGNLYLHYLNNGAAEGRVAYSIKTGEPFVLDANEKELYEKQKTLTSPQARMEAATLAPDYDWPEQLKAAAGNVVENVPGSTPYEKLRACYDWLINNCSYGYAYGSLSSGGTVATEAFVIFEHNVGVCDNYSAAFVVMARMLGYDARLQSGTTHMASGGYSGHTWCVINVHSVDYVFDPQVEDNIAKGGAIRYLRFCKTYDEVAGKYNLYADDEVSNTVMNSTSNDPLPAYSFGLSGEYFEQVNEARAAAGQAPLVWDETLARIAYRVVNGEDQFQVEASERARGNSIGLTSSTYMYGMYPGLSDAMGSEYTRIGVYLGQASASLILGR